MAVLLRLSRWSGRKGGVAAGPAGCIDRSSQKRKIEFLDAFATEFTVECCARLSRSAKVQKRVVTSLSSDRMHNRSNSLVTRATTESLSPSELPKFSSDPGAPFKHVNTVSGRTLAPYKVCKFCNCCWISLGGSWSGCARTFSPVFWILQYRVLRRALRRAHFNCIGILLKWPPRLSP